MNLNIIEVEAETLVNMCKQLLDKSKTVEDLESDMKRVVVRLNQLFTEKKDRLTKLMSSIE